MSIKTLVKSMNSDTKADAVVEHVYSHQYEPGASETHYLNKYFDQEVRTALFDGGTISGRYIKLSPKAQRLKDAFQRRYMNTGEFPPTAAYHRTSNELIAGLIARSGFKLASGYVGKGVCFFTNSDKAESYKAPTIAQPQSAEPEFQVIIEVVVYAKKALNNTLPRGGEEVAHYHEPSKIMTVKNPLVIFPQAVFLPGDKFTNVVDPDPKNKH